MAKFSKTKKQSTFTKTEYKLTDEELRKKNSEAYGIVQQYDEKIASGGYLSAEDLYGYQEAKRTYIDTGNAIRKRLTENGYKFTDADEADWATQVAGLNDRYDQVYGVYSPHTSEDSWKAHLEEVKEYEENKTLDIPAAEIELDELRKQYNAALEQEKNEKPSQSYLFTGIGGGDTSLPLFVPAGHSSGVKKASAVLQERITALEKRIEDATAIQLITDYESVSDPTSENYDPEFETKSVYDPTKRSPQKAGGILGLTSTYDSDPYLLYAAINGDEDAIAQLQANAGSSGASSPEGYNALGGLYFSMTEGKHELANLEEEEKKTYNYLAHEYGIAKANEYYALIRSDLFARERYADLLEMQAYAKEHPIASDVFSLAISPFKGMSYMGQVIDYIDDGKIDENAPYNKFTYTGSDIRNTRAGMIEESWDNALGEGWGKVGSWGYQLGMSMGDFVMATAVSGGNQFMSLAIMGTGAAADMTIAAKQRGLSDDQAFALGTIAGAAEVITEKIGLDALFDVALKGKGALVYALKNAFSEGLEEPTSSVINTLADLIISGDKAELAIKVQEYRDAGASEGAAVGKVLGEYGLSLLGDAAGGMLSGGFMAIPGTISQSTQYRDVGAKIIKKGTASELKAAADTLGVDTNKFNLSKPGQVGQLYYTVAEKISESGKEALTGEMVKNGVSKKAATKLSGVIIDAWMGVEVGESGMDLLASALKDDNITNAMEVVLNGENSQVRIARDQLSGVMEGDEVETVAEDTAEKTPESMQEIEPETFEDVQVEDGALGDVEQEIAPEEVQGEEAYSGTALKDWLAQNYELDVDAVGGELPKTISDHENDFRDPDYRAAFESSLHPHTRVRSDGSRLMDYQDTKAKVTSLLAAMYMGEKAVAERSRIKVVRRPAAQEQSEQREEPATTDNDVDGKTFLESTGEEVKSISVKNIGKGGAVVTVNGGTEASLRDVSFGDERTHLAYSRVTSVDGMTAAAANKILNNPKAERFDFINEAIRAFQGGLRNDGKIADKLDYKLLTAAEAREFYEEGRKAAEADIKAREAVVKAKEKAAAEESSTTAKKGGVFYGYDGQAIDQRKSLTKSQRVAVDFVKRLAKKFGSTFYFYESYVDENGNRVYKDRDGNIQEAKKGFYDPKDGSIHIDLNGDNILFTVSHELVHFIRDWSPRQFGKMADLVMEGFNRQGLTAEELIEAKQAEYAADGIELTEEQAFEEVIAASLEGIMADGRVMEFLKAAEAKDKGLGAKIKKFFQDIGHLIRDTIDSYKDAEPSSAEGRLIRKMDGIYRQLQEAFAEGVYDAGENFRKAENTTNEGGVRYHSQSKKSLEDKYYARLIDQWDGEDHGGAFRVCSPSSALLSVGIPNVDIWFDQSKASKQLKSKVEVDKKILKSIPDVLQNPIAIAESYDNSVVVFGKLYDTWGHPIVVALRVNSTDRRNHITLVNKIRSVGTRNTDLDKLLADSAILYLNENKKETNNWFNALGRSTPFGGTRFGLIRSIAFNLPEVKKDSQGKHLTAKQQAYFAESEAVDDSGNLLALYHQTAEEITEFDPKHPGAGRSDYKTPFGIFLKRTDRDIGLQGKKQMPLYAKATNPLRAENREELVRKLREISPEYAAVCDEIAEMNRTYAKQVEEAGQRLNDYMIEWRQSNPGAGRRAIYDDATFNELSDVEDALVEEWVAKEDELSVKAKEIITSALIDAGYDSVFLAKDTGSFGRETDAIIVLHPNQVKSVSNKNPTDNPDIRYSVGAKTDKAAQEAVERENARLREDVARLTALLKLQGKVTNGTVFTPSSVEAAARYLKKNAGAKGDTKALAKLLNGFYEYIATQKELTWEDVREKAKVIANWLMDHVEHKRSDYAQEILDQIRGSRIRLDESQKAEVVHQYGSYNSYRKSLMGSITLSKDAATSLDSWWQEMATMYPDVFDAEISAADLPSALGDIVYRLRNENSSALEYEHNRRWIEQDLIRDVYDSYWRVSNLRTVADRYAAQINRLRGEHVQRMNELRAESRQKLEQLKLQHRAEVDMIRRAYRDRMEKQRRELSEQYRESRQRATERRKASDVRGKIKRLKARMQSTLLNPSEKNFVPVSLFEAIVSVLELVDDNTELYKPDGTINQAQAARDATYRRLNELKDLYGKLDKTNGGQYKGEFDEYVAAYLDELFKKYDGRSLAEMGLEELEEMYEILKSIQDVIMDARNLIGMNERYDVYEATDAIAAEQQAITDGRKNGKRNFVGIANDNMNNHALSPMRNVERMSGYDEDSMLVKLFREIEKGVRKGNLFMMRAYKMFEELTASSEYDDALYKEVTVDGKAVEYTDYKGRKFGLSKMQMMQAILSYEREQAMNNLNHIATGGFTFADLRMLRKGKLKEAISEENSHRVPAATEMVLEFIEILKNDKWCQDYMAVAREFFNHMAKDAINEASIATKHRAVATGEAYVPFETDQNFVVKEIGAAADEVQQTISSYGMLKDTQNNAPQPLIVTGLNNLIERHISQVGNVYGLAVPIRNFNKVWTTKTQPGVNGAPTVRGLIEGNWGTKGAEHIEQAVRDVQGPRANKQGFLGDLYKKLKSNYIGATFLFNLSVVMKQLGSLFTATSMIQWRNPVSMMANLIYTATHFQEIAAEVDQYTASVWMRRQGLSDAELSTLMTEGQKTWLGKLAKKGPAWANPTKWITGMDSAVALSLWRYCKEDVAARTGLEGEALLEATAEFFDDVVENTQSMTDVLHRPEIQKNTNIFSEPFAMFKTDVYQMAGQLNVAAGRAFANPTKENKRALGKTVYSIAMSAVWGQLMTAAFAALRYKMGRYKDDEDELTWKSFLKRSLFSLGGDLAGYVFPIFGSEIVGIGEALAYGETDDFLDNMTMSNVNELYSMIISISNAMIRGKEVSPQKWNKLIAKALQLFGVPANNIIRLWEAIRKHAQDIAEGEFFAFNEE